MKVNKDIEKSLINQICVLNAEIRNVEKHEAGCIKKVKHELDADV